VNSKKQKINKSCNILAVIVSSSIIIIALHLIYFIIYKNNYTNEATVLGHFLDYFYTSKDNRVYSLIIMLSFFQSWFFQRFLVELQFKIKKSERVSFFTIVVPSLIYSLFHFFHWSYVMLSFLIGLILTVSYLKLRLEKGGYWYLLMIYILSNSAVYVIYSNFYH